MPAGGRAIGVGVVLAENGDVHGVSTLQLENY
jgi:hypothetical protein